MARSIRSSQLETRSGRLKLPISKKPLWTRISPKIGLGYRRHQTAGAWVVRRADGKSGYWSKVIGIADDFDEADGNSVLDFWQAQAKARALGREQRGDDAGRPITVGEAVTAYEADLRTRGGEIANAKRLDPHLPPALKGKPVALLSASDLRRRGGRLGERLGPPHTTPAGGPLE